MIRLNPLHAAALVAAALLSTSPVSARRAGPSTGPSGSRSPLQWVAAANGSIPGGAVVGGQEPGRQLYVCRAQHAGGVHPGKVVGRHCNIGYGGQEIVVPRYEVLTSSQPQRIQWVSAANGSIPGGAVVGGQEPGRQLYVCRARHAGGVHPGKVVGRNCNIGYGGREVVVSQYEVLTLLPGRRPPPPPPPQASLQVNGRPLHGAGQLQPGFMPDPALSTGVAGGAINAQSVDPQCRGFVSERPSFVLTTNGRFRRLRALVSAQGDTTLLARLPNGQFVCDDDGGEGANPMLDLAGGGSGRVAIWVGTYRAGASLPYTLGLTEYDHLTASTLTAQAQPQPQPRGPAIQWVAAANGSIPGGALVGGQEPGRQLYICRAQYAGGVHPGKVVGRNCNIGYGGSEVLLSTYEVMVVR